jgi:hypothetical protein
MRGEEGGQGPVLPEGGVKGEASAWEMEGNFWITKVKALAHK